MKAGFIGLGTLGKVMATRLMEMGVELTLYNKTAAKAEALGAKVAQSPSELADAHDIIFLNLFDSDAVNDVLTEAGGLIESENIKDTLIIDTTTNHFRSALYFHELINEEGAAYLEAPVLGSVIPASKGMLTVITSGATDSHARALPYLKHIGANIFHLGTEAALASKMKLVNNLLLGSFMAALAEGLSFAEAIGLEKENALEVLGAGAGKSLVMDAKRQKLIDGDFSNHFSNAAIHKDLHYLQDLARELERPLFTGTMVKELFGMTFPRGEADEDFSSVYKVFKSFDKKQ